MKSPLNKARIPENKAHEPKTAAGPVLMDPDLQKVMDLAAGIQRTDPETLEGIKKGLEQARAAQKAAADEKEKAETETEFDKACDDAVRAREKEEFFRRLLEKYRFTPRMDEEEYNEAVESVTEVVEKAAEAYRAAAEKHIAALVKAREEYERTLTEADRALSALDNAANVLQTKYRYRVATYVGQEPKAVEDREEWKRHAIRYNDLQKRTGMKLVLTDAGENVPATYNKITVAAWKAAESVRKNDEERY